jgi:hypothetical protein
VTDTAISRQQPVSAVVGRIMKTAAVCNPASFVRQALRQIDRGNSSKKFHVNPCVPENEKSQVAQLENIAEIVKRNAQGAGSQMQLSKKSKAKALLGRGEKTGSKAPRRSNFRRIEVRDFTQFSKDLGRSANTNERVPPVFARGPEMGRRQAVINRRLMACRRCQSPVQPLFCCGDIKSIGVPMNEKTELQ